MTILSSQSVSCRLKGSQTLFVKLMDRRRKGQIDRWTKSQTDTRWEGTNAHNGDSQYLLQYPLSPMAIFQTTVSRLQIIWEWISESEARPGRAWLRSWCWPQGGVSIIHFLGLCVLFSLAPPAAMWPVPPHRECTLCPLWNVSWLFQPKFFSA